ncbi:MAG TPA: hypothetical protein VH325_11195 [Bryobacteraceae bacterium]|nr:hypothetical protein [Bryobacteraceae bacterium]
MRPIAPHSLVHAAVLLPSFFKLCSDKPITRIAGGVAAFCKRGLVVGLLQFQLYDASSLAL